MNDLSSSSDLHFSILFADDTSVFIEETNITSSSQILNTDLENVNIWINLKTVINNIIIDHTNNTKFLGVIIESKQDWSSHLLYT